jgi:DNA-binding transcriptional regulator YbjK
MSLKSENALLLRYAHQFYQSQFSSIQTETFMQDGILANLQQLHRSAHDALEYVFNQLEQSISRGRLLILMENVVQSISTLAKYCEQSADDESVSNFLEHCSELCYFISQSFENYPSLCDLL